MDLLKAIQLNALKCVMMDDDDDEQDRDFQLRAIFRWYSKTFFTPLHMVEELPLVDILTAYIEDTYEKLDPEELEAKRVRLLETDEQRRLRLRKDEELANDDDDYLKQAIKEEQERIAKLPPSKRPSPITPANPNQPQLIIETMGGGQARVLSEQELTTGVPLTDKPLEPLINMTFDDAIEGGPEELDGFGDGMPHPDRNHGKR